MKNALKYLFVFALIFSTAFAGQVWKLPTFGAIEAKPVFFDDKMAIASYDGTIYYIYAQSGSPFAKKAIGNEVNQLAFGNGMVIAAAGNGITILDKVGNVLHFINESTVYGVATGDNLIYASTGQGLKAFSYEGNVQWIMPVQGDAPLTPPLLANGTVIYGAGNQLVIANASDGTEIGRINVSQFWKSKPAIYGNTVYIGSTDGKAYAINLATGKVAWGFDTGAWVMSDPIYNRGAVYVGSNDGNIYAIDATTGRLIWSRKTGEAIEGSMEIVPLGGKELLLFGSNDNRVYALDTAGGNVTLAFSTGGWVHNPTFRNGMIFFGSYDGSYYAYTPDRACSIDSPAPGENVGYKLFDVSGRVFSKNPGLSVNVRVNNLTWQPATISGNDWEIELDPNDYPPGQIFIECRVSDNAGSESQGFTYLVLLRDTSAEKGTMVVESPLSVTQGKAFAVKAMDEDGTPLADFRVTVAGKTFLGSNGTALVNVTADPKAYDMVVKKVGYNDSTLSLSVNYDTLIIIAAIGMVMAVVGVAFYLFVYKRR